MVIDAGLPVGLIANTAAVLALTLGNRIEGIIGPDLLDATGASHRGITNIAIPILKGSKELIKDIKQKTGSTEFSELFVVDFSSIAQTIMKYDQYAEQMSRLSAEAIDYLGIALYGDRNKVARLTGNLPLLR
jgi:hypothetical protein